MLSQIGLMRRGKLLAESPPQQLLEQFQCSFLEEAFLQLCEAQDNSVILTGAQGSDSSSDALDQDKNKYKQTKVYIEIIYYIIFFI